MKTEFDDRRFGAVDNYQYIEYKGKEYRSVSVRVFLDDGTVEWHVIAEIQLEADLARGFAGVDHICCDIDDDISFYATDDDRLYDCLQQITGEMVSGNAVDLGNCIPLRSCFPIKNSWIIQDIDFGEKWFGVPCSSQYWRDVDPIFNRLKSEKSKGTAWSEIENKDTSVYVPLLQAFINEIKRNAESHPDMPRKMVEYLLGAFDFYKVISFDAQRFTQIQAFNLKGSLNKAATNVQPKKAIPMVPLPTRLVSLDFKQNSTTTVELYLDAGWQFSFRIHSAATLVETSLKFDVQIIGMPAAIISINCIWK